MNTSALLLLWGFSLMAGFSSIYFFQWLVREPFSWIVGCVIGAVCGCLLTDKFFTFLLKIGMKDIYGTGELQYVIGFILAFHYGTNSVFAGAGGIVGTVLYRKKHGASNEKY